MTIKSLVRRLSAPVIVFLLTLASTVATVHAAENPRKMTVVSFGLFGDEGVFRREATGAAQIVANRFGGDPVVVKYNTKTGGSATVETLATTLQAEAKKMGGESDILFLILTSHGSRDGLAVVAGRLAETLKPSHLSEMLGRTGVRNKVVIISACYSGVFIPRLVKYCQSCSSGIDRRCNRNTSARPAGNRGDHRVALCQGRLALPHAKPPASPSREGRPRAV